LKDPAQRGGGGKRTRPVKAYLNGKKVRNGEKVISMEERVIGKIPTHLLKKKG